MSSPESRRLKLFVWEDIFLDYSAGMACALAENSEEARKLIAEKMGWLHGDLAQEPRVIESPEGFYSYGGG
jgi:hypothetical protein